MKQAREPSPPPTPEEKAEEGGKTRSGLPGHVDTMGRTRELSDRAGQRPNGRTWTSGRVRAPLFCLTNEFWGLIRWRWGSRRERLGRHIVNRDSLDSIFSSSGSSSSSASRTLSDYIYFYLKCETLTMKRCSLQCHKGHWTGWAKTAKHDGLTSTSF